ncbi:MAG: TIGR00153 family protein [Candidatus Hydrothermarchaeota archaeon]|nr:TIGR00153 family protein [Candidatus Hydrothermarchaeota archaeon]
MRSILSLFAKSPLGPLIKHMGQVQTSSDVLRECVSSYCREDYEKVEELVKKIVTSEREADKIKNYIRERLPKSILMPVDRGDFLNYLREQDQVADRIEEVALNLTLKRMKLSDSIKEGLTELTNKSCDVVDIVPLALGYMVESFETSFANKGKKDKCFDYINELDKKEGITDHIAVELRKKLLEEEKQLTHGEFYLLMRVTKLTSRIADHAENCGDRMRVMMAKQ